MIQGSTGRALVLTASLIAAPGCAPFGDAGWGLRLPAGRSAVMDGEVWSVDGRRGRVQVRSSRGRSNTLYVDRATRVTYRRRSYGVEALERGDIVRVWLDVDGRGEAWADRIEVLESVRERYDRYGYDRYDDDEDRADGRYATPVGRIEGRVGEVDLRNGYFTVEQGFGRSVAVYVPGALDRNEFRRVQQLRRGDRVRAEVRPLSGNEAELLRMR
jgi:hypothetical protein